MNTPAHDEDELRCAEYALGVLDAGERRALEHRIEQAPALQHTLDDWQRRLTPLAEDVPAITPPERVWLRILRDLGWPLPQAAVRGSAWSGWWSNPGPWRWLAFGASAAALVLLAVNLNSWRETRQPTAVATTGTYWVATMARSDGLASWTATIDVRHAHMVVVPATPQTVAANRSTELWLIPPGAKPIPLGVFPSDAPASMSLPAAVLAQIGAHAVLAVSLEPLGGSPTGAPTGPVLATGTIQTA